MIVNFLFLAFIFQLSRAFEITKFEVPSQVHRGNTAILTCEYDLSPHRQLYTLRWLRNNVEFFRFDPALKPQHNFYAVHGLHVNTLKTTGRTLVLDHVSKDDAEGTYTCEVTAFPHFQRISKSARMEVTPHTGEGFVRKDRRKFARQFNGSSSSQFISNLSSMILLLLVPMILSNQI